MDNFARTSSVCILGMGENGSRFWGWENFIARKDLLDRIASRRLTVEADIQIFTDFPKPWIVESSLRSGMRKLLHSSSFADVIFIVQSAKFPAHRAILEFQAPVLATLAEDITQNDKFIPLGCTVDAAIFKSFLHFVYTNELPHDTDLHRDGRKLLNMADKFGCIRMKLFVESEILSLGLTVENSTDLLLYANSKSCALLEEAATKFICDNISAVMETDGWNDIKKSDLYPEILEMAIRKQKVFLPDNEDSIDNDFDRMDVTELRQNLDNLGLDVDGSRKMLLDRLSRATASLDLGRS